MGASEATGLAAAGSAEFGRLLQWTPEQASRFGIVPQSTRHRVNELPWFDDAGLAKLIDDQPRHKLRVFMSGTDPEHRHRDHMAVDTEGANGAEILESVRRGKLWVNLQRIDTVDPRFDRLGRQLYAELEQGAPHFRPAWINRAFLFISSPGAMVYLHADSQPNILWHLRGHKRIFIYPAYDERIVSLARMEELCAGGEDDIDYRHEYEQYAMPFDLQAGDTASWPARAPHRVENGHDVNCSLSTFHETIDGYPRVVEHCADYLLRERLPGLYKALGGSGSMAPVKRLAYRAMNRAGWVKGKPVKEYWAKIRIDPTAPNGVREIPNGPVLTEHSKAVQAMAKAA